MSRQIVLHATDLDGYLTQEDQDNISQMHELYDKALVQYQKYAQELEVGAPGRAKDEIIGLYNQMGDLMKDITGTHDRIQVYSFLQPKENHGEVSRLIAKLRDTRTQRQEFVYYIQRAYELLFQLAYHMGQTTRKNHLIIKTPVTQPVQNYAVHKIPAIDDKLENTVMCVMLRGALLPSMIMSKEIQEYSSSGYVTPFALFRIRRDDRKQERDMDYLLDLDYSYFDLESLNDKDLIFADPMNATGGSLVTIIRYLESQGVVPRSIRFFTVISALKGALQVARAVEHIRIYTLWMDPVLNTAAYILPGLGDAGDRLNGRDSDELPRNMIQLIADYGQNIANLYRWQVREIEQTVLGKMI
ncbi:uracil phosphoribosyltransferase [Spirochaeta lutea]|uniref:Uracil phosphoribosyltransferase n=1 Tax=Spirochaeta lutea TaxID=1480694 RepID=A0A098QTZ5_9SPIO|nr:uracil phosphoribosyltransferase [Spirochaeta lutea]KGE71076.1 uracil phosphoribosyltransferase [Spirochaeta lutea]